MFFNSIFFSKLNPICTDFTELCNIVLLKGTSAPGLRVNLTIAFHSLRTHLETFLEIVTANILIRFLERIDGW